MWISSQGQVNRRRVGNTARTGRREARSRGDRRVDYCWPIGQAGPSAVHFQGPLLMVVSGYGFLDWNKLYI